MTVGSKRRTCRGKEHEIEDAAIDANGAEPPVRDPEELEAAGAPATAEISPLTSLGSLHLAVSDLDRSVEYYEAVVGLELLDRSAGRGSLGVGRRELLVLVELPGAGPASGYTGLYHFALLVPERTDLATWLAHAARDRVALVGLSDHFVGEALYRSDPDGDGIEIYWDRPRETWEGQVAERMTTVPLDVDSLLAELPDPESATADGLADGTIIGHIHLNVAAIPETVAFYGDVLGFGLMATLGPYATFLSAGGYTTTSAPIRGRARGPGAAGGNGGATSRNHRPPGRGRTRSSPWSR